MSRIYTLIFSLMLSKLCAANNVLPANPQHFQGIIQDVFSDLLNRELQFQGAIKCEFDENLSVLGVINLNNKDRCKNLEYTFFPNGIAFKTKLKGQEDGDSVDALIGILLHEGKIYSGFLDSEGTEDADLTSLMSQKHEWAITDTTDKQSIKFEKIDEEQDYIVLRKSLQGYSISGVISEESISANFSFTTSAIHYKRYEKLKMLFNKGKKIPLPLKDKHLKVEMFTSYASEACELSLSILDDEILGSKVAHLAIGAADFESLLQGELVETFSNNGVGAYFELEVAENQLPKGPKVLVYRLRNAQGARFFYEKIPLI